MASSMALSQKQFIVSNHRDSLTMTSSTDLSMVSNRPLTSGSLSFKPSFNLLGLQLAKVTPPYSYIRMAFGVLIFFSMSMTVIIASTTAFLREIIAALHKEFSMTDLGSLNYFFSISAQRYSAGLFLSQSKYGVEILKRANMSNCNPCYTELETRCKLSASVGEPVL
jgi:hypothetical protein